MQGEHHDLVHEFPELKDAIHDLKVNDAHFAKLFDEYHEVNRAVHRMETDVEPVSDATVEAEKQKRLALKDELYSMLKKHTA